MSTRLNLNCCKMKPRRLFAMLERKGGSDDVEFEPLRPVTSTFPLPTIDLVLAQEKLNNLEERHKKNKLDNDSLPARAFKKAKM